VVIAQGEIYWLDLSDPTGSEAGFRRPAVIVQGDALNRSSLQTVVCVPLTSNLKWAAAPGNVLLRARRTGLAKDSVAMAAQISAVDRAQVAERIGQLSARELLLVLAGVEVVLGRG
jgi:mRNA interferase MazF